MATIEEPVFVDGTFHAQNITFGRGVIPGGTPDGNGSRSAPITFRDGPLAGTGEVIIVITAYGDEVSNRLDSGGIRAVTVSGPSPTGFTAWVHRSNPSVDTPIYYMAFRG